MIIDIKPDTALAIVETAVNAGIPHHFVQQNHAVPEEISLMWVHDGGGPTLSVLLHKDGTWRASIDIVAVGEGA